MQALVANKVGGAKLDAHCFCPYQQDTRCEDVPEGTCISDVELFELGYVAGHCTAGLMPNRSAMSQSAKSSTKSISATRPSLTILLVQASRQRLT